ncbi:hypothetical protein JCM8208_002293 [Rhodotorula glutinis]
MAKHSALPAQDPPKPWLKLVVTLFVLALLGYGAKLALAAISDSINSAKAAMEKKGVAVSSSGASVKTNKRALTQEETEDRIQRGIMQGWKASSFNVPWALGKVSNLTGSTHDKNRAEHEKKYGPKKSKARAD